MNNVILYVRFRFSTEVYKKVCKAMDNPDTLGGCQANHAHSSGVCEFQFPFANKDIGEKFAKRLRKLGITNISVKQVK